MIYLLCKERCFLGLGDQILSFSYLIVLVACSLLVGSLTVRQLKLEDVNYKLTFGGGGVYCLAGDCLVTAIKQIKIRFIAQKIVFFVVIMSAIFSSDAKINAKGTYVEQWSLESLSLPLEL